MIGLIATGACVLTPDWWRRGPVAVRLLLNTVLQVTVACQASGLPLVKILSSSDHHTGHHPLLLILYFCRDNLQNAKETVTVSDACFTSFISLFIKIVLVRRVCVSICLISQ